MSTNLQVTQNHLHYYRCPANPRNMGNDYFVPHNYAFVAPRVGHTYTRNIGYYYDYWQTSEYIDDGLVTNDVSLFRPNHHRSRAHNSRNSVDNYLAHHNNFPFLNTALFIDEVYVATALNQLIDTMQNFGSHLREPLFDYRALLDLGDDDTEVGEQAEAEVNSEICVICLCECVNDETIRTLECRHEYHANCIEQWLLKGKKNCTICRSSVLPS
ncbi:hypothetical protein P3S68_026335 [Capsicum galapagoense]